MQDPHFTYNAQMLNDQQKGLAAGLFCFVFWGFAPIYFKLLQHVPASSIIAHRIIWGSLFLLLFLTIRERHKLFSSLKVSKQQLLTLLLSGVLVISNWLIFVWAVNDGQILATSLGYFINPLVNVFLGLLFLHERLNKVQIVALSLAAAATIFLGVYLGQPPWIALALAITFGFYGLVRKQLDVRPLIGLFWETVLWIVPAFIFLYINAANDNYEPFSNSTMALLVVAGLVTIIPLIGFNYAAKRLALSLLGFLQYIAPTISFLTAVIFYGEDFTFGHQVAFAGIWVALLIISWRPMLRLIKRKPKPIEIDTHI